MDVAAWLRGLGLERYEQAFRDNEVNEKVLSSLTAEDLKDLGVTLVGHRRRLLDAIAALRVAVATASASATVGTAAPRDEAERRQLTVMFCDLVGSTALSARLDPEDLREVIGAYHRAVTEMVADLDGFVAKYMGDGVLVYFGYPQAHEDDAERAIRAGLSVIETVGRLAVKSTELQARVGIATGLVVVGDLIGEGSAQEQTVVGETPNLAARLQALAGPDAVVIAAGTRRLVGDLFEYRDLGTVELKGFAEPARAYQVLRPSTIESRFEVLHSSALTPLVGREEEIELLLRRWARAKEGEGHAILLSGEPGIGKSRITAALQERLSDEPHTRLQYFCSPHHRDSPFHPFIAQLERAACLAREDAPQAKLDKLERLLSQSGQDPAETAPFLADLLALPSHDRYPPLPSEPMRRRELSLAALIHQLEGLASERPVLVIFEDVHWIDSSSLEVLDAVLERVPRLPVLFLLTFRPEFEPTWAGRPHVSTLTLDRLGAFESARLAERVAGGKALPTDVVDGIVQRADGIPLFVEELTKTLLEARLLREQEGRYILDGPLPPLAIPSTLHASLLARLDRLSLVKEVAQTAAALGREFSYDLVAAVANRSDEQVRDALRQLTAARLIYHHGAPPHGSFRFKHALVQDAAYSTLLRGQKEQLHTRIVRVLEQRYPELAEEQPEILAHHFTQAGLAQQAAGYGLAAGRRAAGRSANSEAISHYTRALDVLATMPATKERARLELDIQVELGVPLIATFGHSSLELERAYTRAQTLSEGLPGSPYLFRVTRGLWNSAANGGRSKEALERSQQLVMVADAGQNPIQRAIARRAHGTDLVSQGYHQAGLKHLREGSALWHNHGNVAEVIAHGDDPESVGGAYIAWALWFLGYPEQARDVMEEAISAAERLSFPFITAFVFNLGAILDISSGAFASALRRAERALAICVNHVLPQRVAHGLMCSGRALISLDDAERGHDRVAKGFSQWRELGARSWTGAFGTWVAEATAAIGGLEDALAISAQTLDHIQRVSERAFEPESHRVRGELLLRQGVVATKDAEGCFWRGLELARELCAKSWELRAASSLAAFWRDQGKRSEAYDLLAPIYGWFTEGFDTPDLKEAKSLLDELA
jgi:class 3 adenylate cyclase/predicted ATPase